MSAQFVIAENQKQPHNHRQEKWIKNGGAVQQN
jgi:hypothetical protein